METARLILQGRGPRHRTARPFLLNCAATRHSATAVTDLNEIAYAFRNAHEPGARYNGGDSFEEVNSRVVTALEALVAEPDWETLALVAHGGINRLVIGWAFGTGLQTFAAIDQNTCCLNVIDFDEHPETREIMRKSVRAMNVAVYDVIKEGNHLQSLEQIAARLRLKTDA